VHLDAFSYTPCIIGLCPFKFAFFLYTILLTYQKKIVIRLSSCRRSITLGIALVSLLPIDLVVKERYK
jgi:hypothetical protein